MRRLLVLACLATLALPLPSVHADPLAGPISGVLDTNVLPFDRPALSVLAASPKKVYASWHSFANRYPSLSFQDGYVDWLSPYNSDRSRGAYYRSGGYLRSRPIVLPPATPGQDPVDYLRQGMFLDVQWAAEIGIDTFFVNFWYGPSDPSDPGYSSIGDNWRWDYEMKLMFDAATAYNQQNAVAFRIAPNLDAAIISDPSHIGDASFTPQKFAARIVALAGSYDSAFAKTSDGKYQVGVFAMEKLPISWYNDFKTALGTLAPQVSLVASFLDPTNWHAYADAGLVQTYGQIALGPYVQYAGYSEAADRDWAHAHTPPIGYIANAAASYDLPSNDAGMLTMESGGFQTLKASWERAIAESGPTDGVQIITWNDHSEGTQIRPNTASQYAYYDISAYYIDWFKTGAAPTIVRDVLYYSHRIQLSNASLTSPTQQKDANGTPMVAQAMNGIPLEDKIYTMGFLRAGGQMSITSSGTTTSSVFNTPGIYTFSAPSVPAINTQFNLSVNGQTTISFLSAFRNSRPLLIGGNDGARYTAVVWQDLLYRAGSSSRPAVPGVQNNLPEER